MNCDCSGSDSRPNTNRDFTANIQPSRVRINAGVPYYVSIDKWSIGFVDARCMVCDKGGGDEEQQKWIEDRVSLITSKRLMRKLHIKA